MSSMVVCLNRCRGLNSNGVRFRHHSWVMGRCVRPGCGLTLLDAYGTAVAVRSVEHTLSRSKLR